MITSVSFVSISVADRARAKACYAGKLGSEEEPVQEPWGWWAECRDSEGNQLGMRNTGGMS